MNKTDFYIIRAAVLCKQAERNCDQPKWIHARVSDMRALKYARKSKSTITLYQKEVKRVEREEQEKIMQDAMTNAIGAAFGMSLVYGVQMLLDMVD